MPPSKMKAVVEKSDCSGAAVEEVPVPKLEAGEVLVKVDHVTLNPTDWKHVAGVSPAGAIIGCDYSGVVVEVSGGDVHERSHIKINQRVAGWVHGGMFPDKGSFAQYLRVPANLCWPVPEQLTPAQACTFGVPYYTAFHALVSSQKNPWPPAKEKGWFLVYGGSSGVGLFTIQLAKLLGYQVVTTCSASNFDLVQKYGADAVFDYKDADSAIAKIKEVTGGGVRHGLDCISLPESNEFAVKCFDQEHPGVLNVILPPKEEQSGKVKLVGTLLYTLWGYAMDFGPRDGQKMHLPANKAELKFHEELVSKTPGFIIELGFKAPPIEERGGLNDIIQGMEDMKSGKLSGKRFVYRIE